MARDVSIINQLNLWGKQSDFGLGLEPQRNDLYYVDFLSTVNNVAAATNLQLAPVIPQYVRSVTLPEIRTKADPIRRDSVPYNMPSWDDPLDPVKITFVLDTKDMGFNPVIKLLDAWMALTRAGRGNRTFGYRPTLGNWFRLNSNYRVDFQFDIKIYMLRGAQGRPGGFSSALSGAAFDHALFQSDAAARFQALDSRNRPERPNTTQISAREYISSVEQTSTIHSVWMLKQAWLGAYKISDLTYTESALVTVEATFYMDSIDLADNVIYEGQALVV